MKTTLTTTALGLILTAGAAGAQELRFMCYQDGTECTVWEGQFDRFEAENPGITVVVDEVPYQSILESLPVQLEVGEGPDLARVTDYGGLARYMLDVRPYVSDPRRDRGSLWPVAGVGARGRQRIGRYLQHCRPADRYGWLRQQDAVRPSGCRDAGAGRDLRGMGPRLAAPCGTPWASISPWPLTAQATVLRVRPCPTGQRFLMTTAIPFWSMTGSAPFAEQFVAWHEDGTLARDVWAGAGGGTYQDAAAEFINANLVMYYSGSWQIGRFGRDIGDAFDWVATGGICGPEACTGMPGGAGIVGFKQTEHPEAVGKLIEFIAQDDVQAAVLAQDPATFRPMPCCKKRASNIRMSATM